MRLVESVNVEPVHEEDQLCTKIQILFNRKWASRGNLGGH